MKIKILDWELTARFIGSDTDSTLCESEARIIRLVSSPFKGDLVKDKDKSKDSQNIDKFLNDLEASIDRNSSNTNQLNAEAQIGLSKDQKESTKDKTLS